MKGVRGMSPSRRHFRSGLPQSDKDRRYRVRRRQELARNIDNPDGLRLLVDSLIGDVQKARAYKEKVAPAAVAAERRRIQDGLDGLNVGDFPPPISWPPSVKDAFARLIEGSGSPSDGPK